MHRFGGLNAGGCRFDEPALQLVLHGQSPLGAQNLDPLVIAVGSLTRVADRRKAPIGIRKRNNRSIDVARRPNFWVNEAGAVGHYRAGHAKKKRCHIEIVDHHVAIEAAGNRDVVERRRGRVIGRDGQQRPLADLACIQSRFQG